MWCPYSEQSDSRSVCSGQVGEGCTIFISNLSACRQSPACKTETVSCIGAGRKCIGFSIVSEPPEGRHIPDASVGVKDKCIRIRCPNSIERYGSASGRSQVYDTLAISVLVSGCGRIGRPAYEG